MKKLTLLLPLILLTACNSAPITNTATPAGTTSVAMSISDSAKLPTGFTISKRDADWLYFNGSATVTGTYTEEPNSVVGDQVCFNVDKSSAALIPTHPQIEDPWFCFSNQEEAKNLFKIDEKQVFVGNAETLTGTATVTISGFQQTQIEGESWDAAKLDKVVTATPFKVIQNVQE